MTEAEIIALAIKKLRESDEPEWVKCKADLIFWNKVLPYLNN